MSNGCRGLLADGCACGRDEKVLVLPFLSLQETKSILSIFYTGRLAVNKILLDGNLYELVIFRK